MEQQHRKPPEKLPLYARLLLLALLIALLAVFAPSLLQQMLHAALDEVFPLPESAQTEYSGQTAEIHFIDVGQGDSVLIEQNGEYALLDTGTPASADAVVAYLQNHGVTRLRYLLLTHFHADHIGGALRVVQNFPIQTVILPDLELAPMPTSAAALNLLEALNQKQEASELETTVPAIGDTFALGAGELEVIGTGLACKGDCNNTSLMTLFRFDGFTYYSAGDAEAEAEADLLERTGSTLHADLYKASHHGSSSSNTAALLQQLQPTVAVISCGLDNSYGHPHREALEALQEVGAAIYRTDESGSVVVTVQNGQMTVHTEKGE